MTKDDEDWMPPPPYEKGQHTPKKKEPNTPKASKIPEKHQRTTVTENRREEARNSIFQQKKITQEPPKGILLWEAKHQHESDKHH